jgi:hypothetical protein
VPDTPHTRLGKASDQTAAYDKVMICGHRVRWLRAIARAKEGYLVRDTKEVVKRAYLKICTRSGMAWSR